MKNTIYSINGPVVTIKGKTDLEMMEMVYVGKARLVGEVIRMNDRETTIQVYEETGGLKAGEPVESTGGPLSVTLGPGILRNIYDGIQRPLPAIEQHMGSFIERGAHEPSLDEAPSVIISVSVAYSCPFLIPRRSHSSVSSLRTSMDFSRWLIQFSE